ncbi:MAG: hypothetical protein QM776_08250 [Rhodocyclaceae bacterium]
MASRISFASLLVVFLSCYSALSAADQLTITWSEAMADGSSLRKALDQPVRVITDPEQLPPAIERLKPDNYKRSSSFNNSNGDKYKCLEALTNAVKAIVQVAGARQYDAVFIGDGMPGERFPTGTFKCLRGFATNDVILRAEFIVTAEHAKKLAEGHPLPAPPRKVRSSVISIPISEALAMPGVQSFLQTQKLTLHWGFQNQPSFTEGVWPKAFEGSARVSAYSNARAACLAAFENTLIDLSERLEGTKYGAAIRLHSWLADQPAPVDSQFDCEVGGRSVDVLIAGMLVTLKP